MSLPAESDLRAARKRSDARVLPPQQNNSLVDVFTSHGERQPATWVSLRPGDIVRVRRDDFFPADLMFITSRRASVPRSLTCAFEQPVGRSLSEQPSPLFSDPQQP